MQEQNFHSGWNERRVDTLNLNETHLLGQELTGGGGGGVCDVWDGLKSGVVWTGLDENYK